MTPINKFPQARPTKAELGTSKTKLAGYINGVADNLYGSWYKLTDKRYTILETTNERIAIRTRKAAVG